MIGRRSQLVAIGYQLYRVAAGTGGLLVILGAPGSARTALATRPPDSAGSTGSRWSPGLPRSAS